ncbi:hypothetical protein GUJ93_ZPchr0007g4708 [Zizania palustris]|uniref:CBM20 domain-containing protein n=1 Tax=Zizania palustris TaxID=103762 RepID=A0A8J5SLE7_ZIZPA|nr:hypothetical protein GUJ93_ZPchr0007g4708 [Zizania palustris]
MVDDDEVHFTEILPPDDAYSPPVPMKTVQVKLVLLKQCAFGQRFLVVGEDPALGLWDPVKAFVLDWPEDHLWTLALDKHHKIPFELTRKPSIAAQNGSPVAAAADYAGRDGEDATLNKEGEPEQNWPASIFENDMAWARKALQQLPRSLGFQIGKTKT